MYVHVYIYTLRKCSQAICGSLVVGFYITFKNVGLRIFLYLTWNLSKKSWKHIYGHTVVSQPLLKPASCGSPGNGANTTGAGEGDGTRSLPSHRCQVERGSLPNMV